ncbi:MAG: right-handed parallel beta-helix repeat-containing protein, partial [Phycisphaerae bacterium]|nr:right-handed parallel beta-helix repeat-containing protein [Phycisphaerae bacterium]
TSPQPGATGRIQEGHDLVTGSTVYVMDGAYTEDLWISKNDFNLIGSGRTVTTVTGRTTGFADFGMGGNFTVNAADVTISGFKLQSGLVDVGKVGTVIYLKGLAGNAPMNLNLYDNEIVSQAATTPDGNYDVNGIETDYGNFSGVQIHNNRFTGTPTDGYNGIYVNGAVDGANVSRRNPLKIQNNTFMGNVQRAVAVETSNTLISDNTITTSLAVGDAWSGIQVRSGQPAGSNTVSNITIRDNVISGFTWGLKLGMNVATYGVDQGLTDITVNSNTIVGGTTGVLVMSSAENVRLRQNRFAALTGFAVENTDADANILDARRNWWGDRTGPFHATTNPNGNGEAVDDLVQFAPFQVV